MIHCKVDRFETWRSTALKLLKQQISPTNIQWEQIDSPRSFFGVATAADRTSTNELDSAPEETLWGQANPTVHAIRVLWERVERAAYHRDSTKWDLFYRLLWRVARGETHLLGKRTDPDTRYLIQLRREVNLAVKKLQADVRFQFGLPGSDDYALAWCSPEHSVMRLAASLFVQMFPIGKWALFSPRELAEWDGRVLRFGPGISFSRVPQATELVAVWQAHRAKSFRPDRLVFAQSSDVSPQYDDKSGLVFVAADRKVTGASSSTELLLAEVLTDVKIDSRQVTFVDLIESGQSRAAKRDFLVAKIERLRPRMLIVLGATAAQLLFGRDFRVSRQHGQVFMSPWSPWTMATFHPAVLVHVPDLTVRARMQEQLLYDLHRVAEEQGIPAGNFESGEVTNES